MIFYFVYIKSYSIFFHLQLTHAEQKIQRLNQQLKELKLSSLGATPESNSNYAIYLPFLFPLLIYFVQLLSFFINVNNHSMCNI